MLAKQIIQRIKNKEIANLMSVATKSKATLQNVLVDSAILKIAKYIVELEEYKQMLYTNNKRNLNKSDNRLSDFELEKINNKLDKALEDEK